MGGSEGWGYVVGAVWIQLMATAGKTDDISCGLLSHGLGAESPASTGVTDPWLEIGGALWAGFS